MDGGTIAKLEAATVLKRGTLLGKSEDGLLSVWMSPMRSETKAAIFRSPRRYSVRTLSAAKTSPSPVGKVRL